MIRSGSIVSASLSNSLSCRRLNAILGGCALLDVETFDALGFEKQDLDKFAGVASHGRASAEFLEKKRAALVAAHALRERLESGGTITPPVPQQE